MRKFILPTLFVLLAFFVGSQSHNKIQDNKVPIGLDKASVLIQTKAGVGSGTIINKGQDTYVLTANHILVGDIVIKEGKEIFTEVKIIKVYQYKNVLIGEISLLADIVAHSNENDTAILHVRGKQFFPESAKFYQEPKYHNLGSRLYHVGCYYGRDGYNSISDGIISGYAREGNLPGQFWAQTNCVIHPGSSGGGVFLANGEYVGMAVAMLKPGVGYYNPIQNIRLWAKSVGYGYLFD